MGIRNKKEKKASTKTTRSLTGPLAKIYYAVAIVFSLFFLYCAGPAFLGAVDVGFKRGMFMVVMNFFIFLKYPFSKRFWSEKVQWIDWLFIAMSTLTFGYWAFKFNDLSMRVGLFSKFELWLSAMAILVSFEAARRVLGAILPIVGALFVAYAKFGNALGISATANFSLRKILGDCYYVNGIFGSVLDISMTYIVLFVVFGGLMKAFGADVFFIEFPYSLTCGMTGGPGKTAVVASCLFGSISGSATANTAATGAFTIPLMIRSGYRKEVAGAIEPAASTGGMFMPPVMGAATFLMAEMIGVSYNTIIKVALVPALIYFLSVFMAVHFEAKAEGIHPVPKEERPNSWAVFKKGWYFLIPIIVLLGLLMTAHDASTSIYWTILLMFGITVVVRLVQRDRKKESLHSTLGKLLKDTGTGLVDGANGSMVVGAVCGNTGIIMAMVLLTGLAYVFTSSIMTITGGLLVVGLLLAFIAGYILGMGLTVTAVYILLAVLVVPGLRALGLPAIAAHFIVFWFSQTSNISPPVCVAAFVGASIAGADPYKVGFNALRFSSFLLLMPFLFAYSEILMPAGITLAAIMAMASGIIATVPAAAGMAGFFRCRTSLVERILLLLSAVLLVIPGTLTDVAGIVVLVIVWFLNDPKQAGRLTASTEV